MAGPPKLFVSYCHKDKQWLERLQVHFKALERDGTVDVWDDTDIKMGDDWDEEIEEGLKGAKAAILLVSADFLASDYIAHEELNVLLEAEKQGLLILMVILRPCILGELSRFQSVNDPARPLEGMTKLEQEKVFVRLVEGVKKALIVEPESPASQEAAPSPSPSRPLKVLVKQRDAPEKPPGAFLFRQKRIIMGRGSETDLPLHQRVVSKQHAEITSSGATFHLTDLDSKNFTYLNGEQLTPNRPYEIRPGDTIRIGPFEITFEIMDTVPEPSVISYDVQTAFAADFKNPFEEDAKQLAAVLCSIGEQYGREASRRSREALQEALRGAMEGKERYEAYRLIARMLGGEPSSSASHD